MKRLLAIVAFFGILVGGIQSYYLRLLVSPDRERMRRMHAELPYRKLPGYRAFLLEAREIIPEGVAVGLLAAIPGEGSYYAYYRASYLLAGREVIPLFLGDQPLPGDLPRAQYLITWRERQTNPQFELIHRAGDGALWRRLE